MIKNKKIHRPLVEGIHFALAETFIIRRKSDKVLSQLFKTNKKWGSRDRGFIAENTYDIVRWWRRIADALNIDYTNINSADIWLFIKGWLYRQKYDLPDYHEWRGLDPEAFEKNYRELNCTRAQRHSIPEWMDILGVRELGEAQWEEELSAINTQAPVFLRPNHFKSNLLELKKLLNDQGVQTTTVPDSPNALKLVERQNVFSTLAFKEGRFEVQDPGSQWIVDLLDIRPDMRVIDACAGAGGKSLYISNLLLNKGTVIALDIEQWKLDELKRRARRNGAHNIETRLIASKTIKNLRESADRVLLDVPCTGMGTLRRNPDAKWKLSEAFLQEVIHTQAEILQKYSTMVKPGGKLVYATCSILPSENENQVRRFIASTADFTLVEEKRTNTAKTEFDGFYMALMTKQPS